MSSLNSEGSQSASAKKRRHEPIWDNFRKTVEANGEIKWKCTECRDQLSNHKTSVSRHWESKHKDKQQAAVKIGSRIPEGDIISVQIQNALSDVVAIPCLSINLLRHPLFQRLFHALNSKIQIPTSFCTLKGLLNDRCEKVQMQLKADYKKMPQRCSITCDVWADKGLNNSYLGECGNDEEDEEEYQCNNSLDLSIQ
uniref:BED-type domain-containing protein n=1 Tax=Ditylenchus dipsaci TaxID=166011 RepID=A0A915ECK3_9BILA